MDQDDSAPPWAVMADVQRLKAFWREQHAIATAQVPHTGLLGLSNLIRVPN